MQTVELSPEDAPELTELYGEYGWWDDRTVGGVREALANTPLALGVRADGELVAAARVLTDGVYYARVYDVVVAADRRGEGVGERLMAAVVDHQDLAAVAPALICREALVPFYESVGFEPHPDAVDAPEGEDEPLTQLVHRASLSE